MHEAFNENWSITSAAGTAAMLHEAARQNGFGEEIFPRMTPRRWDGSDATGWRVSHDYFTRSFQLMQELCAEGAFGIRLASKASPRAFNNLIYLFMSSANLKTGLEHWMRFQALFSTASRLKLSYSGDTAALSASLADGALQTTVDQSEYFLGLILRYVRWVTGGDIALREVQLTRAAGPAADFEDFFECPVTFEHPANAIIFDRQCLEARSVHACPSVFNTMERLVEREFRAGVPMSTASRVSQALGELDRSSMPELDDVASHLRMSRRTLQRRLTEEGESFSELVDKHCRHLALEALENETLTNEQLAERCGFAETRSFYRAFTRWTGTSPKRYGYQ